MRIRSVTAHAFGPLVGETLEFADGMTVVHGANESAKSSWHAAIYAALCGRRRGRAPSADERRFAELHKPWDRPDWVVSAEVLLDDGRRLEVRQDLLGRVDCDVRDLDLGRDCSDEFIKDGTPDLARWLGLDRHSFLATACVAQAQVLAILDRPGGLQEQLQRAAATAGADQTAAAALAHIDTYRREQVGSDRAPRRPLRLALAAVSQASDALADARAAHTAYQQRLIEADQLRAAAADAERALRRYEAITAARSARSEAEALGRRVREVNALAAEVGEVEPVASADDEATARQVAAALSAWEARPAELAADASAEPSPADLRALAPLGDDLPAADATGGHDGDLVQAGSVAVEAMPVDPTILDPTAWDAVAAEPVSPATYDAATFDAATFDAATFDGAASDAATLPAASVDARTDQGPPNNPAIPDVAAGSVLEPVSIGLPPWGPGVGAVPPDDDATAGLTDQELWDLARDVDLTPPPVDPAGPQRVTAARTGLADAARARHRGRRLLLGAAALALLAVVVLITGLASTGMTAVGAGVATVLAATAVVLGLRSVAASRSDNTADVRRELDAALLEAATALRAEQLVLAQRDGARSRAQRLGLPASADGIRALARTRAGSTMVAERDEQWQREFSQAGAQWQRQLSQTRQEAEREISETRQQAEQRISETRQRAERKISENTQRAQERISETQLRAEQRITETRLSAERKISETRQQVRAQVVEAEQARLRVLRAQEQLRAQVIETRQRAADQVLAAAARCGVSVREPEDAVAVLLRWQREYAEAVAALDGARAGWIRLQSLVGLSAGAGAAEVARALAELRRAAAQAEDRSSRAGAETEDGGGGAAADAGIAVSLAGSELEESGRKVDSDASRLEGLREQVLAANARADLAEGERQAMGRGLASVGEAEEALARAEAELARLRELDQTLEVTRTFLAAAQERAHRTIAPVMVDTVGRWLPAATAQRYTSVIVDPEKLRVQVRGPAGRWRDADLLSHGTAEQVYLLLRIALAQHLARPGTVCPLLLDDVTVHADAERTERILELLLAASAERQIILFTQQDQVRDWAHARLDGPGHATRTLAPLTTV